MAKDLLEISVAGAVGSVGMDGTVRVGIYDMARGPGTAGGLHTALIDSLVKELGSL